MELYSFIDKLPSKDICVICKKEMFIGITSRECSHRACTSCFSSHKPNCPVCQLRLNNSEYLVENQIETILEESADISTQKFQTNVGDVQFLFTYAKADDKRDSLGESFLHKLCRDKTSSVEDIQNFIESRAVVNVQDFAGWTALHEAVIANRPDVVKILLEAGAVVNAPAVNYQTVLHIAVQQRNMLMVKLLIKYGASVSSYNSDGKTPIDLCNKDDVDLLDALCFTSRRPSLYTVFVVPHFAVTCIDVEAKDMERLSLLPRVMIYDQIFLDYKTINYVIFGNKKPDIKYIQMAMLKGAFVFDLEGFLKFAEKLTLNPLTNCMNIPKCDIRKAVLNKLNMQPPLFDSLEFYFNCTHSQKEGVLYDMQDIRRLIYAGGGNLATRRFTFDSGNAKHDFPYHAKTTSDLVCVTKYTIYDGKGEQLRMYNSPTLSYKPFSWFIDCINNFSIE